jgi:hypothetical protein
MSRNNKKFFIVFFYFIYNFMIIMFEKFGDKILKFLQNPKCKLNLWSEYYEK